MNIEDIVNTEEIENVVLFINDYIDSTNKIQRNWINYSDEQLWIELVSCIFGSRVRYETAHACTQHLHRQGMLNPYKITTNPEKFKNMLENEMSKPIFFPNKENNGCKYRYSKTKADYIVRTALEIYKKNNSNLKEILINCKDEYEARTNLDRNAVGVGYKQASLFLRNIYYAKNLAILDSHVIRFMILMNIVENDTKLKLYDKGEYVKLENRLYHYAVSRNKTISTLDIAIWIVMRLVQREFVIWK